MFWTRKQDLSIENDVELQDFSQTSSVTWSEVLGSYSCDSEEEEDMHKSTPCLLKTPSTVFSTFVYARGCEQTAILQDLECDVQSPKHSMDNLNTLLPCNCRLRSSIHSKHSHTSSERLSRLLSDVQTALG